MSIKNITFFNLYTNPFKNKFGIIALFLVLIQIFDAVIPQLQILILHGHMIVPTTLLRIPLLILLIACSLAYGVQLPRMLLMPYILFMTYLAFDFLYLLVFKGYGKSPVYGLATYNNYYSIFLFLPFAFSLYGTISEKSFYKVLVVTTVPIILLGLFQFILNKPILPIESIDKHFEEQSVFFYNNRIRAFSLFSSGLLFGTFCVFLFALTTSMFLMSKGISRRIAAFVSLIALVGAIISLTRSNVVHAFLVLLSVLVLYYGKKYRLIQMALPFILLTGCICMLIVAPVIHKRLTLVNKPIPYSNPQAEIANYTSNESLLIRYEHWKELSLRYIKNPKDLFFGSGLVQSNHSPFKTDLVIDNSYLATILNTGILGLCFMMIILIRIWLYFYNRAMHSSDAFDMGIAAFFATWPFYGLINNAWFVFGLIALVGVFVVPEGFHKTGK